MASYNLSQMLATYSQSSSLSLVLEYLVSDLELVIKDTALVFKTADVKSWISMTLRGLEYCHARGVLHRVRTLRCAVHPTYANLKITLIRFCWIIGSQTKQFADK